MFKALMIVAATVTSGEIRTTMNSMDDCLSARQMIVEQDANAKVLCIPQTPEDSEYTKMQEFFDMFLMMIDSLENYQQTKENRISYE
tara:strand:- start:102 stop:362 length:261 start_codon:yes stop_codon:yes gene_type:complete